MADDAPTFAEFFAAVFGNCIDHKHEQVGSCVYCAECGLRLYHGSVMTPEELAPIKEALRKESGAA